MCNQVDGAIGINIMIGAAGNATQTQVGTGIRLGCINGVRAEKRVPGAQWRFKRTSVSEMIKAHNLPFGRENYKEFMDGRRPAINLHRVAHFVLDTAISNFTSRVGSLIHPEATEGRIGGIFPVFAVVLCQVLVQWRTADIVEVLQNQAIVGGADIGAGGFPENGVGCNGSSHNWATVIAQVGGSGIEMSTLSCWLSFR